jgi:hypothetical protein
MEQPELTYRQVGFGTQLDPINRTQHKSKAERDRGQYADWQRLSAAQKAPLTGHLVRRSSISEMMCWSVLSQ